MRMFDTSVLNDVVTAGCAIVVAAAAALGLRTWREQLRGGAEYELARRLLRAALKVRDEIDVVRGRFIFAGEVEVAVKHSGSELPANPHERSQREYELVVHQRWKRLVGATSEFEAELSEAEVLWGAALQAEGQALRDIVVKLLNALEEHLEVTRDRVNPLPDPPEEAKKRKAIIWRSVGKTSEDEFRREVVAAIGQIEAKLLPKLHRAQ
jgi:hypothetical protein